MDHSLIRTQLPSLVAGHVPSNVRGFKFHIYDEKPHFSALGFQADPTPFEGKVVAKTTEAIVVKIARSAFAVIDRQLATVDPDEGSKVMVTPYARHQFDGKRLDAPVEEERESFDGLTYTAKIYTFGGTAAKLPVPEPRNRELAELIKQLEQLPAPDGCRKIVHLLIDAGAQDFACVDPTDADIIKTPPAISFSVATGKFTGRVTVLYDRGLDFYAIALHHHGECVERVDEVGFDDLGRVLETLIDDGSWRRIKVEVLSPAKQVKRTRAAA